MRNYKIYIQLICLLTMTFILVGCTKSSIENQDVPIQDEKVEDLTGKHSKDNLSVWITYWDTVNIHKEIDNLKDRIKNINYFAAYFNENDKVFIPSNTIETKEYIQGEYKEENWESIITFVNDKNNFDGTSSLKDTDLLYRLFENEESIEYHVNEIINIAFEGDFNGIEIDYEGIKNDIVLWGKYIDFINTLIISSEKYDLSIRVLLEPNTPVEEVDFPEGPEYVMMCYNLFGYGTKPGPKANERFLLEMIEKMKKVSLNRGYALATGGFDFTIGDKAKVITKDEAEEIATLNSSNTARDESSKALYYTYKDIDSIEHEVWYADDITLSYWESIIRDTGENSISIWRITGSK